MFLDKRDAGTKLCDTLRSYKNRKDVLVLALPRGGGVTGFEVARYLHSPLDVLIVRKIMSPLATITCCRYGSTLEGMFVSWLNTS